MKDTSKNYKSILKGTAIFGGVQIFNILINLIKGKLIALLLGTEGMGISSLLTTSTNTIQQFTCLGLNLSSVKELSNARENKNQTQIQKTIFIIRRLLYLTGAVGSIVSILLCKQLSLWTFGSEEYKWHFVFLSIMIFFTTLSNGELSILQGLQAVKKLAFASTIGSCTGLFIGVPLYYFWSYDGIVPAMIALSLTTFIFYRYHTYKLVHTTIRLQWKEIEPTAKKMISLGIILMIASLLGTLSNYLLNSFIGVIGSLHDVGLFQAANSITNQYIGLVFSAMAMDYFPRLSAICDDNKAIKELANQQIEIVILIIAPLASLLILTAPILIKILLTDEFSSITDAIRWMGLGIVLKAIIFPMGYISFAKGDKKTFFWLEGVWSNIFMLCLNMFFYQWKGIYGLGVSFTIIYFIGGLIYIFLLKNLYQFSICKKTMILLIKIMSLLILQLYLSLSEENRYFYIYTISLTTFILIYSLYELNLRINFLHKLTKKIKQ